MKVKTIPSKKIKYQDGTSVHIVPGEEVYHKLRDEINDVLRPHGLAMRFFWESHPFKEGDENVLELPNGKKLTMTVVDPPYAFFCVRTDMDDETDEELKNARL